MKPERNRNLRLQMNWKATVFSAVFLPILVGLGFWQLDRGEEKTRILEQWSARQQEAPQELDLTQALEAYRRYHTRGEFASERYWLREGRVLQGRVGYEVLMPFRNENQQWILVNRGWVAAPAQRDTLPEVDRPLGELELELSYQLPTSAGLVDENQNTLLSWPHRIVEIDLALMASQLDEALYPALFHLSNTNPYAYQVLWRPTNMPPEKHRAYAVQWFAMAFVLFILWLFSNTNLSYLLFAKQGHDVDQQQ